MKFRSLLVFILICTSISSEISAQSSDTLKYIFLGHIKKKQNGLDKVDPRVEAIDFTNYDRIWLGGDVTDESNLYYSNLLYIDSLFDVSNPSNHWAFGNHDLRNYNDEWLREITGKKTYYTHYENGITSMVLNLAITPSDCEKLDDQFRMIQTVCDSIQESTHLIILSHHCVWNDVPGLPEPSLYANSNLKAWIANCYDKPAGFVNVIYPLLKSVKEKGITVINILGDCGVFNKGTEMTSDDDVIFISSGISSNSQDEYGPDKLLILKHVPSEGFLGLEFHELDSL